jgi:UDP-N-acetylmuramyl pentapeptide synthase
MNDESSLIQIKGIKTNSKLVNPGDIFICVHDKLSDRHKIIKDAIDKGRLQLLLIKI